MILSTTNISKSFSGVPVLQDVCFDLNAGEVHILAGENGAGKSTLIKILAGVHADYDGDIELDGRRVRFHSPHDAARNGISVMHQEMSLVGTLSLMDNIFLGREIKLPFSAGMLVDRIRQRTMAGELCSRLDIDADLKRPVDDFPLSVKNRIEIAKALAFDARILIMDEPTSALTEPEVERLFRLIAELKDHGKTILYITHRLEEMYRIGDRITVLRDGHRVGTAPAADLPDAELIRWMIGRELSAHFPRGHQQEGEERLRVENFHVAPAGVPSSRANRWLVEDVSFSVRAGEVLGIAGLQGSGNGALLAGLFGALPREVKGQVYLDRAPFPIRTPQASIRRGLAYVTSDRKDSGLVANLDVAQNISLASLKAVSPFGFLSRKKEVEMATRQVQSLSIRSASLTQEVNQLSGGNQQKVLLARWIETRPRVFLLDEPTRGVDVGAKHEIYELVQHWKRSGIAIVLITSELRELIGLADRILVMHRGRIRGEFARAEATRERILRIAMGDE